MSISQPTTTAPQSTKSLKPLILGAGIIVGAIVLGWLIWRVTRPAPPPPSSDIVTLAKFMKSSRYMEMSAKEKHPYMKAARKNLDAAATALAAGQLKQDEYFAVYLNSYMERKLGDMDDYYALPAAQREATLLKEYAAKAKAAPPSTKKPAELAPKPDENTEDKFMDDIVANWGSEQQTRWEEFRRAVKHAKDAAKKSATPSPSQK